jgi:hypothetical protein
MNVMYAKESVEFQQFPAITIYLPAFLPPLLPLPLFIAATRSPSPKAELTKTLWRSLEVIPIVLETHSVSFGYTSLVRYSYYIPRQY